MVQASFLATQVALPMVRAFAQPGQIRLDKDPFTLGVASGFPVPDGASLWTRLAPAPMEQGGGLASQDIAVRVEIASDASFAKVLQRLAATAEHSAAHSVHVQVRGLGPATPFFYRFVVGTGAQDWVSPVGRCKTAPAVTASVKSLRIAVASCQHFEAGFYTAHQDIAAQDLDLVLFLGDYIYEGNYPLPLRVREHETNVRPTTLDQYRQRYALYKQDPHLQASHAAHPWVITWDDHEVENDYADRNAIRFTPPAEFMRQRAAAYQAYFEHMPLPPSPRPLSGNYELHRQFAWGQLAHIWTLDNRQFRSPQACAGTDRAGGQMVANCDALAIESRTMLGAAQEDWFSRTTKTALGAHTAAPKPWALIGQATQMSRALLPSPFGAQTWTDGWDGYPKARERLLANLATHTSTLVLGGDVHRNVAANLRLRPGEENSPVVASEFVATSISSRGSAQLAMTAMRRFNDDLLHVRSDERGYALLDIDAQRAKCDFRVTSHPVRASSKFTVQASYVSLRGQPGTQAA